MTPSDEEKAVNEAVERLRQAMIGGSREALDEAAAESLSYGHSNGNVESKPEFIENIASGRSRFVTIDLSEQSVSITDSVSIVRHRFSAATNDGGKPAAVNLKILLVFIKEKAKWKLLARQAVRYS